MDIIPRYYGQHNIICTVPVSVYLEFGDGLAKYLSSIHAIRDIRIASDSMYIRLASRFIQNVRTF